MPLSVIGAGLPRTGTMSLKLALERLGLGPCHHMSEVFLHPERVEAFVRVAEGEPDWEAAYQGYASGVDAPTCFFWHELSEAYPTAKIVLTVRDPDAWFDSTQATVLSPTLERTARQRPPFIAEFMEKVIARVSPLDRENQHDREFMVATFKAHNAQVQATAVKDRLLVYEVAQGWDPLCRFLGVPVPNEPFPRVNRREDMAGLVAALADERSLGEVQEGVRGLLGKS
jgi:hypothetical protein